MATYPYTTGIPNPPNSPSVDVPNMQTNTNSIASIIAQDHIGFGLANGGYHTIIHQLTGAGTQNLTRSGAGAVYANIPANIANVNQIVAGQYTPDSSAPSTDTQLFNLTGSNVISQLTGQFLTNTALSDGWAWVGGILFQWGFVTPASSTSKATINFKSRRAGCIPFPNNIFTIIPTIFYTNSVNPVTNVGSNVGICNPIDNTQFTYTYTAVSSFNSGFYWLAIGN